jgi:hypothetical protein
MASKGSLPSVELFYSMRSNIAQTNSNIAQTKQAISRKPSRMD